MATAEQRICDTCGKSLGDKPHWNAKRHRECREEHIRRLEAARCPLPAREIAVLALTMACGFCHVEEGEVCPRHRRESYQRVCRDRFEAAMGLVALSDLPVVTHDESSA